MYAVKGMMKFVRVYIELLIVLDIDRDNTIGKLANIDYVLANFHM